MPIFDDHGMHSCPAPLPVLSNPPAIDGKEPRTSTSSSADHAGLDLLVALVARLVGHELRANRDSA